jgi:cysteinyl-tRNA synthetase
MTLRIYNTKSRTLEDFKPINGNRVLMFVCGPTVYDQSHIGHARTYLAYDIIARYLRAKGYSLFYLMNITDVDDKIINKANTLNRDPLTLASEFTKEFLQDMTALGIDSVNLYAKASEHIREIIMQISTLISKGAAYQVNGDVYFDVSSFRDYGQLSRQDVNQLVTHRIDPDPRKKSAIDFALWKSQKPNEPAWDSPWGKGRPGWHIEDSAITATYFGPSYDLHGGGLDLIFPHHEAEIAQAESATGSKPLVKYWIHSGLLTVNGTRMGKSMGNFITIKDALLKHNQETLRLFYATSHYRSQLEYSEPNILQAEQVLEKIRTVFNQFKTILEASTNNPMDPAMHAELLKIIQTAKNNFNEAMDDDFNTPRALAAIIAYAKNVEPYASKRPDRGSVEAVIDGFNYFGDIFGILQSKDTGISLTFERLLRHLVSIREDARTKGDWKTADTIRDYLKTAGVFLEDTSNGVRWHIKPTPSLKSS